MRSGIDVLGVYELESANNSYFCSLMRGCAIGLVLHAGRIKKRV